jgi:hypothetical protein
MGFLRRRSASIYSLKLWIASAIRSSTGQFHSLFMTGRAGRLYAHAMLIQAGSSP